MRKPISLKHSVIKNRERPAVSTPCGPYFGRGGGRPGGKTEKAEQWKQQRNPQEHQQEQTEKEGTLQKLFPKPKQHPPGWGRPARFPPGLRPPHSPGAWLLNHATPPNPPSPKGVRPPLGHPGVPSPPLRFKVCLASSWFHAVSQTKYVLRWVSSLSSSALVCRLACCSACRIVFSSRIKLALSFAP